MATSGKCAPSEDPITMPVALSETNQATGTRRWFVQQAEYRPAAALFRPLVNGEEAFGAVYDAIDQAQHTVDIICWGFQASMFFRRDGKSLCIGDLLIRKGSEHLFKAGAEDVVVRVLCWDSVLPTGVMSENTLPGKDMRGSNPATPMQIRYDSYWHMGHLNVKDVGLPLEQRVGAVGQGMYWEEREDYLSRPRPDGQEGEYYANVHFRTRDFSGKDHENIKQWLDSNRADKQLGETAVAALSLMPTHHQKMVLVDYEYPEIAVGFVMGHNMLDEYWDTPAHSMLKRKTGIEGTPNLLPNGKNPRQDVSSQERGPILQYLNDNFCLAWDRATGENLSQERESIWAKYSGDKNLAQFKKWWAQGPSPQEQASQNQSSRGQSPQSLKPEQVEAQVLRTQIQEDRRDIEPMYLQAVGNVTNFIYIENQYFRWPPLAQAIREAVAKQRCWGRPSDIYLFVVTNASKEGISEGVGTTYRMLDALGQAGLMPKKAQKAKDSNHAPQAVPDGLKVHICTLVPPDTPAGQPWGFTYVHAKVLIVDDVFTAIGSANVNTRSMEVDSELDICHECGKATRALREKLWGLHTKLTEPETGTGKETGTGSTGESGLFDAKSAYEQWTKIINDNKANQRAKLAPVAPLIEFFYDKNGSIFGKLD